VQSSKSGGHSRVSRKDQIKVSSKSRFSAFSEHGITGTGFEGETTSKEEEVEKIEQGLLFSIKLVGSLSNARMAGEDRHGI
jgi:hypothetical protein